MKTASRIYLALVFIFLYAPLAVMILISFNGGESTTVMDGTSLRWNREMLRDGATLQALQNTVVLSISSAVIVSLSIRASAIAIRSSLCSLMISAALS